MKPLFIPLNTEYFDAFADGSKREVLSKGYGKKHRLGGRIWKFKRQHGSTFGSTYRAAILDVFGTLDIEVACIAIELTANFDVTGDPGTREKSPP